MPYTQAFLAEIMRYRPISPFAIPHLTTSDLKVNGYHVPKGTGVMMNIIAINLDPEVWSDPDVFQPERFLSKDGARFIARPEVVSFGAGRRACIGEQLAKMEAFLFLTSLLQRSDVSLPEGALPCYGYNIDQMNVLAPLKPEIVLTER